MLFKSLTIPAAFFWWNVSLCWYYWLFMKIVYHYIFILAINYLIFIHVLLIFNDTMILFHGLFWCLTHEKKTPEGAASRPGFRGFRGLWWRLAPQYIESRFATMSFIVSVTGCGTVISGGPTADSRQPIADSGHQPTGFPPPERQRTQPLLYNLRQSRVYQEYCQIS